MPETKPEKKSLIQKLQDKVPDREEQFEYISVAVRLLVVFLEWCARHFKLHA